MEAIKRRLIALLDELTPEKQEDFVKRWYEAWEIGETIMLEVDGYGVRLLD